MNSLDSIHTTLFELYLKKGSIKGLLLKAILSEDEPQTHINSTEDTVITISKELIYVNNLIKNLKSSISYMMKADVFLHPDM